MGITKGYYNKKANTVDGKCGICGLTFLILERHHINRKNQKIIYVCKKCHDNIHKDKTNKYNPDNIKNNKVKMVKEKIRKVKILGYVYTCSKCEREFKSIYLKQIKHMIISHNKSCKKE